MAEQMRRIPVGEWPSCILERAGSVYILTLTGNSDHRLNPSSIDDISSALRAVDQSPDAGALVTTNQGRYFSNGLDLRWIQQRLSPATLTLIQHKFEGLLAAFMKLGLPTFAAIRGHAAAGGFMLALAHDYRFMKEGREVLYMSELDHGMFIPRSLMSVIRSKLSGPDKVREVVLKARMFSASDALKLEFVDQVFDDGEKTVEAAVEEAGKLAGRNWKRDSYANLRAGAFPGVIEELEAHMDPYVWRLPPDAKL